MKFIGKIILIILGVLFGPLAFLLFLTIAPFLDSPIIIDNSKKKYPPYIAFFFESPKGFMKEMAWIFLVQIPILLILGVISFFWTQFVFKVLFGVDLIQFNS